MGADGSVKWEVRRDEHLPPLRVSRLGDKKRRPVGAPLPALPLPPGHLSRRRAAQRSPRQPQPALETAPQEPGLRRREAKSPLQGPGISNRGRGVPEPTGAGRGRPQTQGGVPNNPRQEPRVWGGGITRDREAETPAGFLLQTP